MSEPEGAQQEGIAMNTDLGQAQARSSSPGAERMHRIESAVTFSTAMPFGPRL